MDNFNLSAVFSNPIHNEVEKAVMEHKGNRDADASVISGTEVSPEMTPHSSSAEDVSGVGGAGRSKPHRLSTLLFLGVITGSSLAWQFGGLSTVYAEAGEMSTVETELAKATFAGGCFWCMEAPFDELPGVKSTIAGYAGGHTENPTYRQVTSGETGHTEVVQVTYDPEQVSYEKLLEVFWRNIDPTVKNRQFCDTGTQYRSAIFYHSPTQKAAAEESFKAVEAQLKSQGKGDVFTELAAMDAFYPAEGYHQDYYLKNPIRYKFYRYNCGRDQRLEALWGSDKS
jgi:peptide-methionine (S)-S-oxide reductase